VGTRESIGLCRNRAPSMSRDLLGVLFSHDTRKRNSKRSSAKSANESMNEAVFSRHVRCFDLMQVAKIGILPMKDGLEADATIFK
jgi:hypothetical protein